ncbi:MAG TPA: hypothetical protein VEA38_02600 [Terriglobales bacterium]|nr:hypothetical protein [Terriglobales bacterium]
MKLLRNLSRVGLIVLAVAGCDNVDWGGVDVAVVPPPPRGSARNADDAERQLGPLPTGPVLYYVRTDSAGGTIVPVGEIGGDSLIRLGADADPELYGARFISEHLRRGAEFTLFRRGSRVGTLVVQSAQVPATGTCRRLPMGRGTLEIGRIDSLAAGVEFIALAKSAAPEGQRATIPLRATGGMARVAPILAERALRARGAQLPGNWGAAMAQIQPFPVSSSGDAGIASTFLVDDQLQVGNDDMGYSLFMIAVPRRDLTGYDTVYVDHQPYERGGKRAPRVVDFLDWDRDGGAELLLEVYGTSRSWYESVGPVGETRWARGFAEQCDGTVVGAATARDSAMRDTVESGGP